MNDRLSLESAGSVLAMLRLMDKVVILVANKAELVRSRVVTEVEGKTLAERYGAGYIETSAGIDYNVDQLLVKIVHKVKEKVEKVEKGEVVKKMFVTDKIKDLVVRRPSKENQENETRKERKLS